MPTGIWNQWVHGCPEYAWNKALQIKCDYIPAYDVYSLGIVMAELIFGHVNGHPTNASQKYILNEETLNVDGWKQLKDDADKKVTCSGSSLLDCDWVYHPFL